MNAVSYTSGFSTGDGDWSVAGDVTQICKSTSIPITGNRKVLFWIDVKHPSFWSHSRWIASRYGKLDIIPSFDHVRRFEPLHDFSVFNLPSCPRRICPIGEQNWLKMIKHTLMMAFSSAWFRRVQIQIELCFVRNRYICPLWTGPIGNTLSISHFKSLSLSPNVSPPSRSLLVCKASKPLKNPAESRGGVCWSQPQKPSSSTDHRLSSVLKLAEFGVWPILGLASTSSASGKFKDGKDICGSELLTRVQGSFWLRLFWRDFWAMFSVMFLTLSEASVGNLLTLFELTRFFYLVHLFFWLTSNSRIFFSNLKRKVFDTISFNEFFLRRQVTFSDSFSVHIFF